jgi:hypothetical protein
VITSPLVNVVAVTVHVTEPPEVTDTVPNDDPFFFRVNVVVAVAAVPMLKVQFGQFVAIETVPTPPGMTCRAVRLAVGAVSY